MKRDSQDNHTDKKLSVSKMKSEGCGNWRQLDQKEPWKCKAIPLCYKWGSGAGMPCGISQARLPLGASGARPGKEWWSQISRNQVHPDGLMMSAKSTAGPYITLATLPATGASRMTQKKRGLYPIAEPQVIKGLKLWQWAHFHHVPQSCFVNYFKNSSTLGPQHEGSFWG